MSGMKAASGLILSAALAVGAAPAAAGEPSGGTEVLHEGSAWRCSLTMLTPVVRTDAGFKDAGRSADGRADGWKARTPFPPGEWMAADFDDSSWSPWNAPRGGGSPERQAGIAGCGGGSPIVALQCLRGRFLVADPAQVRDLKLSLAWRGGVVVYVNGREIARANLPASDKPDFAALAEDYPPEVFVKADGKVINYEAGETKAKDNAERLARRVRRLAEVSVAGSLLRKGTNVLAVELHRAPQRGNGLELEDMNTVTVWSTCGLVSLSLRAGAGAEPLPDAARGPQLWNGSTLKRLAPGCRPEPGAKLGPVNLVGCRNGRFAGKVVVSSDGALRGVKASASELATADGKALIPAAAVGLFYTTRDDRMTMMKRAGASGFWDTLAETPPAEVPAHPGAGAFQAVWVKAAVPADAAPGDYSGTLTVSAEGLAPTPVPVRLRVHDWKLPDPRDYVTHLGLIQSPESVALFYDVPLWSEAHWKLLERSFRLMGEIGGRQVCIPLITKTNFGNEQSMIRWVRKKEVSGVSAQVSADGKKDATAAPDTRNLTPDTYTYDFAAFDRYLDLAQKHIRPDVVVLYAWELRKYAFRLSAEEKARTANPVRVSLLDPATGQVTEMQGPHYKDPEAVAFWKPVLEQVKARLEKRGLGPAVMLGLAGDVTPTKEDVAMFGACLPGTKWVRNSHPDTRGSPLHGVPLGYNTAVYVPLFPPPGPWDARRPAGWRLPHPTDVFPRAGCNIAGTRLTPYGGLSMHRVFTECCFLGNYSGLGRTGVDFWPVGGTRIKDGEKRSHSIVGRYMEANWDQLNMDTATENLLAPGPEGALGTERYELLREGVQDCEARAFIEKVLLDGKLDAALAGKCQEVLDERAWALRAACMGNWNWFEGPGFAGLSEKLYGLAAEVAARTGAR